MNISEPLPSVSIETQKQAIKLKGVSEDAPSKVKLFARVFRGEASPRLAIKAYCLECLQFRVDDIRTCTAPDCPLFAYRPFQRRGEK
jgi:hypothetical protein